MRRRLFQLTGSLFSELWSVCLNVWTLEAIFSKREILSAPARRSMHAYTITMYVCMYVCMYADPQGWRASIQGKSGWENDSD